MQTSVQDWPGRTGLWHVGVPPSGPMDALSFRLANALVGNDSDAAGVCPRPATPAGPRLARAQLPRPPGALLACP
jgi:urea carboxylase